MNRVLFFAVWVGLLLSIPIKALIFCFEQTSSVIQVLWRGTEPLHEYLDKKKSEADEGKKALKNLEAIIQEN